MDNTSTKGFARTLSVRVTVEQNELVKEVKSKYPTLDGKRITDTAIFLVGLKKLLESA